MKPGLGKISRMAVVAIACAVPASYAQELGWRTIVNNGDLVPGTSATFHAYNQPAVNSAGMAVFRARGKPPGGGEGLVAEATTPTEPNIDGVYLRDMAAAGPITLLAKRGTLVPSPNSLAATFTEFPSTPRIDAASSFVATRGQSQPAYAYLAADGVTESRIGTSGVYANPGGILGTGASLLGAVMEVQPDSSYALSFPKFSVPDALAGTRFDQFPGSPTATNGSIIGFKGNFTDPSDGIGKTGVYYRDVVAGGGNAPVTLIASTSTRIPNQPSGGTVRFGATAPPSAAGGWIAFTGWDNEDAPTMGGVYRAAIMPNPTLQTLAGIGDSVPGEPAGSRFTNFGEGLSISEDGRYVAFWGSWGTETTPKVLICPDEGNKPRLAYCQATYPTGYPVAIPVHQGVFVADALSGQVIPIAKTGTDGITDFVYWVYSGAPPGVGGSEDGTDESREPPRWRWSAFTALASKPGKLYGSRLEPSPFQIAFKAARDGVDGVYVRKGDLSALLETLVETLHSQGQAIDPEAPANSIVTAVGIERDGFRNENLAISASMLYETVDTTVSWAGLYLANVPALKSGTEPTVALATTAAPSDFGDSVTFTALVSGSAGTPTGSVDFLDGNTPIQGCSGVAVSGGMATCTTSSLTATTHSITAIYSGDSKYFSRTSNDVAQPVNPPPSLSNLSTRIQVLTGDDVLIGGFIIGGSSNKTVIVRGIGPSLASFGIANPLANPTLRLVRSSDQATIATNDDWGSAANAADVTASGFAPSNPLESAILINLPPGAYTAIVSGVGSGTGVGMFEVFEVDHPDVPFENVSARGRVIDGDGAMIAGFVVPPNSSQRLMVRARGPSLMAFGVSSVLSNPTLQLVRSSDHAVIATNDNWVDALNAAGILASGFAPIDAFESAIMITLNAGAYTAIASGVGGASGVAIIEIFRLP